MNSIKDINIVPEPVSMTISTGNFTLTDKTTIYSDKDLLKISEFLNELIHPATGFDLEIKEFNKSISLNENSIILQLNNNINLGAEGYLLSVTSQQVKISAKAPKGIFYGIQTLRQLLPINNESKNIAPNVEWEIPCIKVKDFPRFSWRGYMLDEARHFHGKEVVKRILDLMALLKLNKFHWHLTDDQGWRIEIKNYPKLTEIGSKREESPVGKHLKINRKKNGIPHFGFYSQKDIQEIIDYASDRFITIIPEINMPGHTRAALASYPNLSCRGYPLKVSTRWSTHKDIFCIGKEETFEFAHEVLTEIVKLFPSNMVHIGGDEVLVKRWQECPKCQSRIKTEGLSNEKELQVYFTNRIYKVLTSLGQKVICWNDAIKKNTNRNIICQFWLHGQKKVHNHIKEGGCVIKSNFRNTYLDLSYSFIPLKRAYRFDPIPKMLRKKYHKNILGLEAPMWGELTSTSNRIEWQTFPRLIAFAETGWTPRQRKNYSSFQKRLINLLKRLDILGVNYAKKNKYKPKFFKRIFGFLNIRENQNGNI